MKIVIATNNGNAWLAHCNRQHSEATAEMIVVEHAPAFENYGDADAFIDMCFDGNFYSNRSKPLLVGETITPLKELPHNFNRIGRFCNWPGFTERDCWEIALSDDNNAEWLDPVMKGIHRNYRLTSDEPGLIAPRILACIINEAMFALSEEVSTAAEIDMAMKLGTNYPAGPFEWAAKIGFDKINTLLKKLAYTDSRYTPHPLLAHFEC